MRRSRRRCSATPERTRWCRAWPGSTADSGERDPEIYAALRAEFPGRVSAIFIRDAGGDASPARFAGMTRFAEPAEAALQAAALGLADAACVAREFPPPSPAAPPP